MKRLCVIIVSVAAYNVAAAQTVPLPRPRPALAPTAATPPLRPAITEPASAPKAEPAEPSACRIRLTSDIAIAPSLPPITGPGECGTPDPVKLEAVVLPDKSKIAFTPPATLRCTMAEAVASWVREDAIALAQDLGGVLRAIENFDSYDCRGRNRVVGAITSEHGKANAIDVRGLRLADGKFVEFTDPNVSHGFREKVRTSVCARFTTVLGPGSDGYHENHIHVDLAQRRSGYRICQWNILDPTPAAAVVTTLPLPLPRPKIEDATSAAGKR
jgi:hypothetical protein